MSIASASTTVTLAPVGDDVAQQRHDAAVDLDGGDVGAGVGQGERERPEAGADLDDVVARPDPGEVGDAAHGVGVGDEVLAEVAAGSQVVGFEELADRRPGVRSPSDLDRDRRVGEVGDLGERVGVHDEAGRSAVGVHAVGDAVDAVAVVEVVDRDRVPVSTLGDEAGVGGADRARGSWPWW